MVVALTVKNEASIASYVCKLGTGDYVFCFFSTVSYRLEGPDCWGSRFPYLLKYLCDYGIVKYEDLEKLRWELRIIRTELRGFTVSQAVYDIGDLNAAIPWDIIPGEENNDLSQPWVIGRNDDSLFRVFEEQLDLAQKYRTALLLKAFHEKPNPKWFKKRGRNYWKELQNNIIDMRFPHPSAIELVLKSLSELYAIRKDSLPPETIIEFHCDIIGESHSQEELNAFSLALKEKIKVDTFRIIYFAEYPEEPKIV